VYSAPPPVQYGLVSWGGKENERWSPVVKYLARHPEGMLRTHETGENWRKGAYAEANGWERGN